MISVVSWYTISNMEFEPATPNQSPEISDNQRLTASARRVTIAPLHAIAEEEPVIRPREDVDPSVQVSQSLVYIASESEDTSTYQAQETPASITNVAGLPTKPHSRGVLVFTVSLFALITGGIVYLLLR